MRRAVLTIACLLAVSVGSLAGAAVVLASGTSTSAGDQQYVDPLTGTSSTSQGSPSSSSSSSSSSSGASSSTGSSSASQTPSAAPSGSSSSTGSTATASHASATGKSLPFTGMNVGVCVALGLGLLGTGLVLRRVIRSA